MAEVQEKVTQVPAHILMIDDEPHICRLVEIILQRVGYRVTCVQRLAAARKVIASDRPDVVILDVSLPRDNETDWRDKWNGFEFSRELREDPATAALPVILMPLRAADDSIFGPTMRPLLARENRLYLYKPFNPEWMLATVKKILDPDERTHVPLCSRIT